MAFVKSLVSVILFYILTSTQSYWFPSISWLVNWVVIGSISWFLSRRITRDFICKKVLPRVNPEGKAVLITGEYYFYYYKCINESLNIFLIKIHIHILVKDVTQDLVIQVHLN